MLLRGSQFSESLWYSQNNHFQNWFQKGFQYSGKNTIIISDVKCSFTLGPFLSDAPPLSIVFIITFFSGSFQLRKTSCHWLRWRIPCWGTFLGVTRSGCALFSTPMTPSLYDLDSRFHSWLMWRGNKTKTCKHTRGIKHNVKFYLLRIKVIIVLDFSLVFISLIVLFFSISLVLISFSIKFVI